MGTKRLIVRGRMHPPGMCDALLAEAAALGLNGWVKARADGSVEATLQGDPDALTVVIDWATRGPSDALVTSVEVDDADGAFERLELLS